MDQIMFHPLGDCVALDSQTVQSLLDSQGLSEVSTLGTSNITSAVMLDEEDVIQCGKCKKQFNSLTLFMSHKEEHKMETAMSLHPRHVNDLSTQPTTMSALQVQTLDTNTSIIIEESDILSFSIDENGSFLSGHNVTAMGPPIILTSSEFASCASSSQAIKGSEEEQIIIDQSLNRNVANHTPEAVASVSSETKPPEPKVEKLKCDFCGKAFAKNFDLQQHVRSHTGEKPFQCVVCGRAFSQKSNVKKHMATHKVWPEDVSRTLPKDPLLLLESETTETVVLDRSYVCQYCSARYSSYFELKTHMTSHAARKVYKCIQKNCLQTFTELDEFLLHTKEHTNQVQYRCHVCNKQFETIGDLGLHHYSHKNNPSRGKPSRNQKFFRCTSCKSRFMSPEALEHHRATTNHNYPCTHCGKIFACERYLRRHLPTHGAAGAFTCAVCGKGFRTEQYLNTHMLIHSSEKPHECQHCAAAFNRKDKLARHVLIHQPVKRFKCPFRTYLNCNKEFNRQDKLKLHLLTHSYQKQSYQCPTCSRVFQRYKLLQQHEKLHHKPGFMCALCEVKCPTKLSLQTHVCADDVPLKKGRKSVKKESLDNVPTIEIIVMPVSRDRCEEPTSSGLYHVTFPAADHSDGEVATPDQEVPV